MINLLFFNSVFLRYYSTLQQTIVAWRNTYLLGSAMFLIFGIVWTIFGSSEVQWWDTYWLPEGNSVDYHRMYDKSEEEEIPHRSFDFY